MNVKSRDIDILRSQGLRATSQRLELLEILNKATKPLSIPELQKLGARTTMDTATFYRGLETLSEVGLVRKIDLRHGHTDYERADGEDHHHHIVCKGCKKIESVKWCPDSSVTKKILKATGFSSLSDHSAEFFGLCTTCA